MRKASANVGLADSGKQLFVRGTSDEDLQSEKAVMITPASGSVFKVLVNAAATLGDVKQAITAAKGFHAPQQMLFAKDGAEPLDDSETITAAGTDLCLVLEEAVVYSTVFHRLKDGGRHVYHRIPC